eukprot:4000760-Amphidinium_carterae.1
MRQVNRVKFQLSVKLTRLLREKSCAEGGASKRIAGSRPNSKILRLASSARAMDNQEKMTQLKHFSALQSGMIRLATKRGYLVMTHQ